MKLVPAGVPGALASKVGQVRKIDLSGDNLSQNTSTDLLLFTELNF